MSDSKFVFCPRCNAITLPGICSNCGFRMDRSPYADSGMSSENANNGVNPQGQPVNNGVNPQSQPAYNGANPQSQPAYDGVYSQGQPVKRKSSLWIWLLAIGIPCVVVVFAIASIIVVFLLGTMSYSHTASTLTSPSATTATSYVYSPQSNTHTLTNPVPNCFDGAKNYTDETNGVNDKYLKSGYVSTFAADHTNHARSTFSGPYYNQFEDSFDKSFGYTVKRHFVQYSDKVNSLDISANVAYVEIVDNTANIPNLDKLNEDIKTLTFNDLYQYFDGKREYSASSILLFDVDSFCIYNDDVKMSILLDINVYPDGNSYSRYHYIYPINIDVNSGKIIENDAIITADSALGAKFETINNKQNGTVDAVTTLTDQEIADYINDKDTSIIFFTPIGLEIGFNYYSDAAKTTWGWVTVSLEDYDSYLIDQKYCKNEDACKGTAPCQINAQNQEEETEDGSEDSEGDASETENGTEEPADGSEDNSGNENNGDGSVQDPLNDYLFPEGEMTEM